MGGCQVEGCERDVSKPGHTLCLQHWKLERDGKVSRCEKCQRWHETGSALCRNCASTPAREQPVTEDSSEGESATGEFLSSTRIGKHFGISNIKVNLILAELGWIERYVKGWVPTDRGNALGANVREMRNGTPFVVWPAGILGFPAFVASIKEQTGGSPGEPAPGPARPASSAGDDFRSKFPANFRTQDGHMVRSRAEVLIDNWLYMQGIVHAYERRLPIEEECYCDFYLPGAKMGGKGVYIEFWGLESDPKYRERKAAKQAIYAKHALRLIELGDAEIERLDDVLPRMLLRFGIESA